MNFTIDIPPSHAVQFTWTEGTVKAHVKSILAKLNAASRTEAIAIAHRRGLLPYESEGKQAANRRVRAT
jgi:Bacterial regulatory proteins, luxR family